MKIPLISRAQPAPAADVLPPDLAPSAPFDAAQIRRGLPEPGAFRLSDLRWCR